MAKEKDGIFGAFDKRSKSQAFHVCIQWVQIPYASPLEFGRTLLIKKTVIITATTWGASTRN